MYMTGRLRIGAVLFIVFCAGRLPCTAQSPPSVPPDTIASLQHAPRPARTAPQSQSQHHDSTASRDTTAASDTTAAPDTSASHRPYYDPFGPENSPDHTGQGSGGVVIPTPNENTIQAYFTRINADYYGIQYMLDSPFQIAAGSGWSAYETNGYSFQLRLRTTGFKAWHYEPLRDENVPYYILSSEGSFEYPYRENGIRAYKVRMHWITESKGLGMPGVGVVVSKGNLLVAGDRAMGRRAEFEGTWIQVAGGYVMPLSPTEGGVNLAICGGVELFGLKYQAYYADPGDFLGAKVGSIGWMAALGWNATSIFNLGGYVGGEYGFSTGGLITHSNKIVFSDIARTTIFLGLQGTGRWFNVVGGIQKEWEYIDFQSTEVSDKALRYYLGLNFYLRR